MDQGSFKNTLRSYPSEEEKNVWNARSIDSFMSSARALSKLRDRSRSGLSQLAQENVFDKNFLRDLISADDSPLFGTKKGEISVDTGVDSDSEDQEEKKKDTISSRIINSYKKKLSNGSAPSSSSNSLTKRTKEKINPYNTRLVNSFIKHNQIRFHSINNSGYIHHYLWSKKSIQLEESIRSLINNNLDISYFYEFFNLAQNILVKKSKEDTTKVPSQPHTSNNSTKKFSIVDTTWSNNFNIVNHITSNNLEKNFNNDKLVNTNSFSYFNEDYLLKIESFSSSQIDSLNLNLVNDNITLKNKLIKLFAMISAYNIKKNEVTTLLLKFISENNNNNNNPSFKNFNDHNDNYYEHDVEDDTYIAPLASSESEFRTDCLLIAMTLNNSLHIRPLCTTADCVLAMHELLDRKIFRYGFIHFPHISSGRSERNTGSFYRFTYNYQKGMVFQYVRLIIPSEKKDLKPYLNSYIISPSFQEVTLLYEKSTGNKQFQKFQQGKQGNNSSKNNKKKKNESQEEIVREVPASMKKFADRTVNFLHKSFLLGGNAIKEITVDFDVSWRDRSWDNVNKENKDEDDGEDDMNHPSGRIRGVLPHLCESPNENLYEYRTIGISNIVFLESFNAQRRNAIYGLDSSTMTFLKDFDQFFHPEWEKLCNGDFLTDSVSTPAKSLARALAFKIRFGVTGLDNEIASNIRRSISVNPIFVDEVSSDEDVEKLNVIHEESEKSSDEEDLEGFQMKNYSISIKKFENEEEFNNTAKFNTIQMKKKAIKIGPKEQEEIERLAEEKKNSNVTVVLSSKKNLKKEEEWGFEGEPPFLGDRGDKESHQILVNYHRKQRVVEEKQNVVLPVSFFGVSIARSKKINKNKLDLRKVDSKSVTTLSKKDEEEEIEINPVSNIKGSGFPKRPVKFYTLEEQAIKDKEEKEKKDMEDEMIRQENEKRKKLIEEGVHLHGELCQNNLFSSYLHSNLVHYHIHGISKKFIIPVNPLTTRGRKHNNYNNPLDNFEYCLFVKDFNNINKEILNFSENFNSRSLVTSPKSNSLNSTPAASNSTELESNISVNYNLLNSFYSRLDDYASRVAENINLVSLLTDKENFYIKKYLVENNLDDDTEEIEEKMEEVEEKMEEFYNDYDSENNDENEIIESEVKNEADQMEKKDSNEEDDDENEREYEHLTSSLYIPPSAPKNSIVNLYNGVLTTSKLNKKVDLDNLANHSKHIELSLKDAIKKDNELIKEFIYQNITEEQLKNVKSSIKKEQAQQKKENIRNLLKKRRNAVIITDIGVKNKIKEIYTENILPIILYEKEYLKNAFQESIKNRTLKQNSKSKSKSKSKSISTNIYDKFNQDNDLDYLNEDYSKDFESFLESKTPNRKVLSDDFINNRQVIIEKFVSDNKRKKKNGKKTKINFLNEVNDNQNEEILNEEDSNDTESDKDSDNDSKESENEDLKDENILIIESFNDTSPELIESLLHKYNNETYLNEAIKDRIKTELKKEALRRAKNSTTNKRPKSKPKMLQIPVRGTTPSSAGSSHRSNNSQTSTPRTISRANTPVFQSDDYYSQSSGSSHFTSFSAHQGTRKPQFMINLEEKQRQILSREAESPKTSKNNLQVEVNSTPTGSEKLFFNQLTEGEEITKTQRSTPSSTSRSRAISQGFDSPHSSTHSSPTSSNRGILTKSFKFDQVSTSNQLTPSISKSSSKNLDLKTSTNTEEISQFVDPILTTLETNEKILIENKQLKVITSDSEQIIIDDSIELISPENSSTPKNETFPTNDDSRLFSITPSVNSQSTSSSLSVSPSVEYKSNNSSRPSSVAQFESISSRPLSSQVSIYPSQLSNSRSNSPTTLSPSSKDSSLSVSPTSTCPSSRPLSQKDLTRTIFKVCTEQDSRPQSVESTRQTSSPSQVSRNVSRPLSRPISTDSNIQAHSPQLPLSLTETRRNSSSSPQNVRPISGTVRKSSLSPQDLNIKSETTRRLSSSPQIFFEERKNTLNTEDFLPLSIDSRRQSISNSASPIILDSNRHLTSVSPTKFSVTLPNDSATEKITTLSQESLFPSLMSAESLSSTSEQISKEEKISPLDQNSSESLPLLDKPISVYTDPEPIETINVAYPPPNVIDPYQPINPPSFTLDHTDSDDSIGDNYEEEFHSIYAQDFDFTNFFEDILPLLQMTSKNKEKNSEEVSETEKNNSPTYNPTKDPLLRPIPPPRPDSSTVSYRLDRSTMYLIKDTNKFFSRRRIHSSSSASSSSSSHSLLEDFCKNSQKKTKVQEKILKKETTESEISVSKESNIKPLFGIKGKTVSNPKKQVDPVLSDQPMSNINRSTSPTDLNSVVFEKFLEKSKNHLVVTNKNSLKKKENQDHILPPINSIVPNSPAPIIKLSAPMIPAPNKKFSMNEFTDEDDYLFEGQVVDCSLSTTNIKGNSNLIKEELEESEIDFKNDLNNNFDCENFLNLHSLQEDSIHGEDEADLGSKNISSSLINETNKIPSPQNDLSIKEINQIISKSPQQVQVEFFPKKVLISSPHNPILSPNQKQRKLRVNQSQPLYLPTAMTSPSIKHHHNQPTSMRNIVLSNAKPN